MNELIKEALEAGVLLFCKEGKLGYRLTGESFPDELKQKISAHKQALIEHLSEAVSPTQRPAIQTLSRDQENYALSFSQQRFWFIDQMSAGSTHYNMPLAMDVVGALDRQLAQQVLQHLVQQHEILRTTYHDVAGQGVQRLLPDYEVKIEEHDLSHLSCTQKDKVADQLIQQDAVSAFDLSQQLPLRVSYLKLSEQQGILLFNMHHIATDGWSINLFIQWFCEEYKTRLQGKPSTLSTPAIQYIDYAQWQQNEFANGALEQQLDFWQQQLEGIPAVHGLPLDYPRPAQLGHDGARHRVHISNEVVLPLQQLAQQHQCSLFVVLQTLYAVLLARHSDNDDIVMGTPVANRSQSELNDALGCFVNTLVLRSQVNMKESFSQLLQRNKKLHQQALAHADVPFECVVEKLNPQRSAGYSPVFQFLITLEEGEESAIALPGVAMTLRQSAHKHAQFELMLNMRLGAKGLVCEFEYNTNLFKAVTIERLAQRWSMLLQELNGKVEQPLVSIPLIPKNEHALLQQWLSGRNQAFESELCVHQVFERKAAQQPDAVAVVFEQSSLTYQALNEQANQLARWLISAGVTPGSTVALALERSLDMVVAIYAVVKAGAAYLPMDPGQPRQRQHDILQDAKPTAILTQSAFVQDYLSFDIPCVDLQNQRPFADKAIDNLNENEVCYAPEQLAYVIYTSGSTGKPKGVLCHHLGLHNRIDWMQREYSLGQKDVVLQKTPYTFDVSVWEFFWPLMTGATLVVAKPEGHKDPLYLQQLIQQHQVSTLHFVPSMLSLFLTSAKISHCTSLRQVFCSGEALSADVQQAFFTQTKNTELHNLYGPTEAAIDVSYWACERHSKDALVPIGQAIQNTELMIVDEQLNPVPIGVSGELLLGGLGVAYGYLNRAELTAEKFIQHPFKPQQTLYRTGDIVRCLERGVLEYMGRSDHQVKLRGLRIELGEIEAAINTVDGLKDAVVTLREDVPGDQRLVAYFSSDKAIDKGVIKQTLAQTLPEYMLPSAYMKLDTIPLTANGKVDRKALPMPDDSAIERSVYAAPKGEAEKLLANIWADLLSLESVSRHDNFFNLGGHSLLITQCIIRLNEAGFTTDIAQVFATPVLCELAAAIESRHAPTTFDIPDNRITRECVTITPEDLPLISLSQQHIDHLIANVPGGVSNIQDIYPLTPMQEGILFHHQLDEEADPYITTLLYRLADKTALNVLTELLTSALLRHDVLRTSIHWQYLPQPVQVVWRQADLPVEYQQLPNATDLNQWIEQQKDEGLYQMNLQTAPLVQLQVFECGEEAVVKLHIHHLIHDNLSLQQLEDDMMTLLMQQEGTSFEYQEPTPFRNFVTHTLHESASQRHHDYFKTQLADVEEVTAPFGLADTMSNATDHIDAHGVIKGTAAENIRRTAQALKVSNATLFHMVWALIIGRSSGTKDVVMGTVMSGRQAPLSGIERMFGMFINTLPLRLNFESMSLEQAAQHTHKQLIELMQHELISLSDVQSSSALDNGTPLFSAMLNYRHVMEGDFSSLEQWEERLSLKPVEVQERSNYPFAMSVDESAEAFELTTHIHRKVSAQRVMDYVITALENLCQKVLSQNNECLVHQLNILPQQERQRQFNEFNQTQLPMDTTLCIQQRLEQYAAQQPDALALIDGDVSLTYGELNAKANQLAHYLIAAGIKPDSLVGLHLPRSIDALISLWGILKAGAGYLPLDPSQPASRLQDILSVAEPELILGHSNSATLPLSSLSLLDTLHDSLSVQPDNNLAPAQLGLNASHLAYVIFTSGSTGKPKGVMIEHRNLVNLTAALEKSYQYSTQDRVLQFAALSFDMSVEEVFGALGNGATLVLRTDDCIASVSNFFEFCEQHQLTALNLPTAFWHQIVDEAEQKVPSCIRQISVGGEALSPEKVNQWFQRDGHRPRLVNAYGPTECTVNVCIDEDMLSDSRSIGKPIANYQVYVLDNEHQPVPLGAVGELFVGGAGVARGYLNRPDLTAERFICHPQLSDARLYGTGDLVAFNDDGSVIYLGRNDDQVKVRGYRIELGEVEAGLNRLSRVRLAKVKMFKSANGDNRLAGYLQLQEAATESEIRTELEALLPGYMIPDVFVLLDAFPLTPNGKIDIKALPKPEFNHYEEYVAPEGEQEELLAEIWSDIFQCEKISRHSHFFHLGGHSLLIMKMVARLQSAGWSLAVRKVFETPQLSTLATSLISVNTDKTSSSSYQSLPADLQALSPDDISLTSLTQNDLDVIVEQIPGGVENIQDIFPLAPLQEGILFHHMLSEGSDTYVTPMAYQFKHSDKLEAFVAAFKQLVLRHDALRTAILWNNLSHPVQVVCRQATLEVNEHWLNTEQGYEEQLSAWMAADKQWLNIQQAPLLKLTKLRQENSDVCYLIVQEHHLISDHVSLEILQDELIELLNGTEDTLPEPVPYGAFIAATLQQQNTSAAEQFFAEKLAGVNEVTAPYGIADNQADASLQRERQQRLDDKLSAAIRTQARRLEVSPAAIFHLAWAFNLALWSGRQDVVTGTVVSGRMQAIEGMDRMVGLFINTLPLRVNLQEQPLEQLIVSVQQELVELMAYEHIPTAVAERCSELPAGSPLFNALINYRHSEDEQEGSRSAQRWQQTDIELLGIYDRTNYPFTLSIDDLGDGFNLTAQIHQQADIDVVLQHIINSLTQITQGLAIGKNVDASRIVITSKEERAALQQRLSGVATNVSSTNLAQVFEQQVERTPNHIAVVDNNIQLSYTQLNQQANQLAHYLQQQGVKIDDPVGLFIEPGCELIIALLAILKAGAGYVPLDTALPPQRLQMLVDDLGEACIVCSEQQWSKLKNSKGSILILNDELRTTLTQQPTQDLQLPITAQHLGYVLYTSGSTGKPKAIAMQQGPLLNLLQAAVLDQPLIAGPDKRLQFSSIGFDMSFEDIFFALQSGGSLHMISVEMRKDISSLTPWIAQQKLTALNLPYAALQAMADFSNAENIYLPCLRHIISTAERLKISPAIRRFFERHPDCRLTNHYGPAETHVVTAYTMPVDVNQWQELPPIGRPLANVECRILDQYQQPVPASIAGELYLGAHCVSRGYLNQPQLTQEKFIELVDGAVTQKYYRTGDQVRLNSDDTLEYIGREDDLVKVRGFRIELSEIEACLLQVKGVSGAVVLVPQDASGQQRLVAYIEAEAGLDKAQAQTHLKQWLPDYMVPQSYMVLERFPINVNGKVDRSALPEPVVQSQFEAPATVMEHALAECWQSVLSVTSISRHDSFFELGGHSLLATRVKTQLSQQLSLDIPVSKIFELPRLLDLAAWLDQQQLIIQTQALHAAQDDESLEELEW
ncbi:non-ribosomal peptide synthetase [Pleionea sp. CnH1-48]|uniref:non-ribosomal peptide synthetase n=1 Tax=Pleionea sp. CnH1-48 TaxID=2954494 RepID=UPI0020976D38|nr:non-ribosomal peptide synthetase [Pleionea sp. CnH1-48]MCO7224318.1 amino acid adenylation domain-containing protein [Pleionea sp. CnH1-48]